MVLPRRAAEHADGDADDVRDELEARLRAHRPRLGVLEEADARARRSRLDEQARRFERFFRAAAAAARHGDERVAKLTGEAEAAAEARVAKIAELEASLKDVASVKGVEIRGRDVERAVASAAAAATEAALAGSRARRRKRRSRLREAPGVPRETFEGDETYAEASVAAYAKRMETLEAAAARSREAHLEAIDDVKARVAEKTEAARASLDAAVPAHAEDLRVKDAVARLCEKARRDLGDLLARSDADAAALEREMREIERVGEKNAPRLAGPRVFFSLAVGRSARRPREASVAPAVRVSGSRRGVVHVRARGGHGATSRWRRRAR